MSATIIAVANQKGGTGKTTTCENLGIGLANKGKHVLLVDTDPQASLTIALGHRRHLRRASDHRGYPQGGLSDVSGQGRAEVLKSEIPCRGDRKSVPGRGFFLRSFQAAAAAARRSLRKEPRQRDRSLRKKPRL